MKSLAAAAAVVVIAIATAGHVAASPAPGLKSESGVSLAEAMEFRSTFGFSTDQDTVAATLKDPTADTTWGTPLTPAEATNMAERQRLALLADPLDVFVGEKAESFGGIYYDQTSGRLVATIATTSATPDEDLTKAMDLVPEGLPVKTAVVAHTMAELQVAEDKLADASESLGLRMVGIDTRNNALVATMSPGRDTSAPARSVGVPVVVTVGEGPRLAACWNTCTPWRGGMNIWDQSFPVDGNCTWGFYGTRGGAAKYVISAGHCGKFGHVLRIKSPSNSTVVFTDGIDQNTYDLELDEISESDAQTAHVKANANATTPFNKIIGSSSDLNHTITGIKNNSQNQGATVCFFGFKSHRASPCGTITIINIVTETNRADDGKHLRITNLREMSLPAQGGDSGGPVYSGALAYGINTGIDPANSNHLIYSMIANVQLNTGTNVCTSSAC